MAWPIAKQILDTYFTSAKLRGKTPMPKAPLPDPKALPKTKTPFARTTELR